MRAERLPQHLPSDPIFGDDGLGGYRDTEALGVVHPAARSRFEQAVLDQMNEVIRMGDFIVRGDAPPGHTDLMVSPEALDQYLAEHSGELAKYFDEHP